jgi:hypothetical protein
MQAIKAVIFLISITFIVSSCDSKLDVNAEWKDITVVYGLLDQNDTVHYIKITKAFLGPGNALSFAKIADSSNYPERLEVRLEGWEKITQYDSSLKQTILFDTITISNKEAGDSIFYYPSQLVYKSIGTEKLNSSYIYKLFIRDPRTGKLITAQTNLVEKIGTIDKPVPAPASASFIRGKFNQAVWTSAKGGKRYQLVGRFYYLETKIADPSQDTLKYVDWIIFNNIKTETTIAGNQMDYTFPGVAFYTFVGSHIPVDPSVNRAAMRMEYIFTVAGDDLNTYMEVTEPSYTIVQEKPPFTNINNGIGVFSARHNNTKDYPIIQITFSQLTLDSLKGSVFTSNLGF